MLHDLAVRLGVDGALPGGRDAGAMFPTDPARVFDELGYRRYEWKCDSLNAPSRAAALRLGFQYEGLFRQAVVYKGRNRDTTWFSIIDDDWPALKRAYQQWLAPENFDSEGRQRRGLAEIIRERR